jgi:S-DNA-T family DNA segregation ATPase FtsK/SpoIIIE
LEQVQEEIETALEAEVNFTWEKGLIRIDIMQGKIPQKIWFKLPEELPGEIPFIVGMSRKGLITADLAELPHLLVAGTTGAGKSNFLLTLVTTILQTRSEVELHIIDRKQVEFSFLQGWVTSVEHSLEGSVRLLERLAGEMEKRKAFLSGQGKRSLKEYLAEHPEARSKIPYKVLLIDEFSQISTLLAHDEAERKLRSIAMKRVVDIACIARSLGIQVVVATQYPTSELIHNQLRANLNGRLIFKCEGEKNSEVCLGNGNFRAYRFPSVAELPGRAVWQHRDELEVQVPLMPLSIPPLKKLPQKDNTLGSNVWEDNIGAWKQ